MSHDQPRNVPASVKARLLQIAKDRQEQLQSVLTRYTIERLLYRLGQSQHRHRFVLKGANLFALWLGAVHRPTYDVDFLGYGNDEIATAVKDFQEICRQTVEDDGLAFEAETVTGTTIRDGERYAGIRITLQVDIGFGDVVTPAIVEAELPTLLDGPKAQVLTYPRETVVAEKCEAMVDLGMANTRLKDFYDLWHLATHFDFEGVLLCRATEATFRRRGTAITPLPIALTSEFSEDENKRRQWEAFWRKSVFPPRESVTLAQCTQVLRSFLLPVLEALDGQTALEALWSHERLCWERQDVVG